MGPISMPPPRRWQAAAAPGCRWRSKARREEPDAAENAVISTARMPGVAAWNIASTAVTPAPRDLVEEGNDNNPVHDRDADSETKPIAAEMPNASPEIASAISPPATANGSRSAREAVAQAVEEAVEQAENQQQADRHDRGRAASAPVPAPRIRPPNHAVAVRQRNGLGDFSLASAMVPPRSRPAHAEFDGMKR